jgi:hypothetical protein
MVVDSLAVRLIMVCIDCMYGVAVAIVPLVSSSYYCMYIHMDMSAFFPLRHLHPSIHLGMSYSRLSISGTRLAVDGVFSAIV